MHYCFDNLVLISLSQTRACTHTHMHTHTQTHTHTRARAHAHTLCTQSQFSAFVYLQHYQCTLWHIPQETIQSFIKLPFNILKQWSMHGGTFWKNRWYNCVQVQMEITVEFALSWKRFLVHFYVSHIVILKVKMARGTLGYWVLFNLDSFLSRDFCFVSSFTLRLY